MTDLSLEDRIYECAFVPEMWPGVLDQLATMAGCLGGCFVLGNDRAFTHWAASLVMHRGMTKLFAGDFLVRSERKARLLGAHHAGFVRDTDHYTADEMERDVLYRDFLWPLGLGACAATAVAMPTGDVFMVTLERLRSDGPVAPEAVRALDVLRPHIARSAFLAARQQLSRADAATDALAQIGLPAIVLSPTGKVLAANRKVEDLTNFVTWRAGERFAFKDRAANTSLRLAVETVERDGEAPVRSFAVRDAGTDAAMVAHVLPLRGSAQDIFVGSAAIVVMTPVAMPEAPPAELVQSLFDLTPAEARVARGIAAGGSVETIADSGGVTVSTVRSHLRGVLGKTGCHRQAEVAALLGAIAVPRGVPVG